jgi:NADPH:quinone reductase-like Zn-dependent oxidoreductase
VPASRSSGFTPLPSHGTSSPGLPIGSRRPRSYELSGVVVATATDVGEVSVGEAVYALPDFGRDGAAADHALAKAGLLAEKP